MAIQGRVTIPSRMGAIHRSITGPSTRWKTSWNTVGDDSDGSDGGVIRGERRGVSSLARMPRNLRQPFVPAIRHPQKPAAYTFAGDPVKNL